MPIQPNNLSLMVEGSPLSQTMRIIGALAKRNGGCLTVSLSERRNIMFSSHRYDNEEVKLLRLVWNEYKKINSEPTYLCLDELKSVQGIIIHEILGDFEINAE